VVSFLFLFTWWQFCIVQILSSPKTFLHISSAFFRSLIGNFLSFFAFSHSSIGNFLSFFFIFFAFSPSFDGEFSFFFVFFWGQGLTFSPWVKVYGKLGFWLKACRTAGHDICQDLANGSGIKGMPHIISMIHMQQWWLGNFMQNWLCMHLCGHSSIKFFWSCDTRAQDSFSLFKSTQCFQNMFFYQFMHSSEFILGVQENFHSIHPSGVLHTFSFKNWLWSVNFFSKKSWKLSLFKSMLVFQLDNLFFFFLSLFSFFPLFLSYYHLFISFFSEKVVWTRAHTTSSRLTTR